jgi:aspartyl-tRNA(Asn)/glutamyl-tRNA(Gln) amidotransferase subunit B
MTGEFSFLLNQSNLPIENVGIKPQQLAQLLNLLDAGVVNQTSAKAVLGELFEKGGDPQELITKKGLTRIDDQGELDKVAAGLVEKHADQVAQYLAGKETVFEWLLGQVMRATRGKADPQRARQALRSALDSRK